MGSDPIDGRVSLTCCSRVAARVFLRIWARLVGSLPSHQWMKVITIDGSRRKGRVRFAQGHGAMWRVSRLPAGLRLMGVNTTAASTLPAGLRLMGVNTTAASTSDNFLAML